MTEQTDSRPSSRESHSGQPPAMALVIEALQRLRFGAIQLTVHEGRLVQVDVTERSRFPT